MDKNNRTISVKKKRSYKSLHDVLLLENNQHQDSDANCASYKAASHHPVVDHFPITAHRCVLSRTL